MQNKCLWFIIGNKKKKIKNKKTKIGISAEAFSITIIQFSQFISILQQTNKKNDILYTQLPFPPPAHTHQHHTTTTAQSWFNVYVLLIFHSNYSINRKILWQKKTHTQLFGMYLYKMFYLRFMMTTTTMMMVWSVARLWLRRWSDARGCRLRMGIYIA